MRLIDADKLKDAECAECQFVYKDVETCRELGCGIMERIDEQPTIDPVKED